MTSLLNNLFSKNNTLNTQNTFTLSFFHFNVIPYSFSILLNKTNNFTSTIQPRNRQVDIYSSLRRYSMNVGPWAVSFGALVPLHESHSASGLLMNYRCPPAVPHTTVNQPSPFTQPNKFQTHITIINTKI